jgi:UTP--glucose-1-phosphate uridylyltransferase
MSVNKAVIPAAGLGTRFLPATKAQPKEMLVLVDKPAIHYIVEECVASGVHNLLLVTGRNKRTIEDYFDRSLEIEWALKHKGEEQLLEQVRTTSQMGQIHYVRQQETLGLGHAVLCAKAFVGPEDFAVLLPDDLILADTPCLTQMLEVRQRYEGAVIALEEVPPERTSRYGIIAGRELEPGIYQIEDLVEKPSPEEAPSNLAVVGRYLLPAAIFPILEDTPPGAGGEIQLTDALRVLAKGYPVFGYRFRGRRYDLGDKLGFLKASLEIALRRADLGPQVREFLAQLKL